jgi:hypothetical protein
VAAEAWSPPHGGSRSQHIDGEVHAQAPPSGQWQDFTATLQAAASPFAAAWLRQEALTRSSCSADQDKFERAMQGDRCSLRAMDAVLHNGVGIEAAMGVSGHIDVARSHPGSWSMADESTHLTTGGLDAASTTMVRRYMVLALCAHQHTGCVPYALQRCQLPMMFVPLFVSLTIGILQLADHLSLEGTHASPLHEKIPSA